MHEISLQAEKRVSMLFALALLLQLLLPSPSSPSQSPKVYTYETQPTHQPTNPTHPSPLSRHIPGPPVPPAPPPGDQPNPKAALHDPSPTFLIRSQFLVLGSQDRNLKFPRTRSINQVTT
ncbi:hypothetical protein IQ07DRAFT_222630 [Pyrenochaeta sp. DS3sAY3a]|nr:hypothetical protein IQ07DRAFT_222630 [Pyrenochaeta sp. DS3sAY3a]